MKSTDLRQLIRESIQEYIREIDAAGDRATLEAKMKACEEAIALREKKSNMDGLDEAYHDMLDKGKIGELKKEIKALGKTLEKYKKQLAKMDGKNEPKKEKEDKEVIDETPEITAEVDMNEYTADPNTGPELEEDQLAEAKKKKKKKEEKEEKEELNESFLHMQKLAGLITEAEYQKKKQILNEDEEDELTLAYANSPKILPWDVIEKAYQESGLSGEEFFAGHEVEFKNQFEGKPISKEAYFNFYANTPEFGGQDDRYTMVNWIGFSNPELADKLYSQI